jgi:hypothetical protein
MATHKTETSIVCNVVYKDGHITENVPLTRLGISKDKAIAAQAKFGQLAAKEVVAAWKAMHLESDYDPHQMVCSNDGRTLPAMNVRDCFNQSGGHGHSSSCSLCHWIQACHAVNDWSAYA